MSVPLNLGSVASHGMPREVSSCTFPPFPHPALVPSFATLLEYATLRDSYALLDSSFPSRCKTLGKSSSPRSVSESGLRVGMPMRGGLWDGCALVRTGAFTLGFFSVIRPWPRRCLFQPRSKAQGSIKTSKRSRFRKVHECRSRCLGRSITETPFCMENPCTPSLERGRCA